MSVAALAHRAHDLGLIREWHYHRLCVQISQLGYRKTEPAPMVHERSQVLDKVFRMLRDEGIQKADLAAMLTIRVSDLDELVFGLTLAQIVG